MLTAKQKKIGVVGGIAAAAVAGAVWWLENQPSITIVDPNLTVGGYAVWAASGMNANHVYVIGALLPDGSLYYDPNNDTRVNSESADGVYSVDSNMVGATMFVLYDQTTSSVAATTPCTVMA